MPRYPEGGRHAQLGELLYAHNLWLDVAYDVGPIPTMLLLVFHASHAAPAWRWLRRGKPYLVTLVLAALGVSFLATFVAEPVLASSQVYFSASCLLLAVTTGLDEWVRAARASGG
jgi:hypothetical protein